MTAADPSESDSVFQLKGNMLAVTVLELLRNDLGRLDRQLAQKVAQAPNFFQETPLVLGLDKLAEDAGPLRPGRPPRPLPPARPAHPGPARQSQRGSGRRQRLRPADPASQFRRA